MALCISIIFLLEGANESDKIGLKSFSMDGYIRGFRILYAFCIFQFKVCSGTRPTNDAHWLNVLPGPTIKSQIESAWRSESTVPGP